MNCGSILHYAAIDTAAQKSRVIQRKLKAVEEVPATQAKALLGTASDAAPAEDALERPK